MMPQEPIEARLRSIQLPGPRPELRARVLARAVPALAPPATLAERLWASRPARMALAASFLLCLLLEVNAAPSGHVTARASLRLAVAADLDIDAELASRLEPPPHPVRNLSSEEELL